MRKAIIESIIWLVVLLAISTSSTPQEAEIESKYIEILFCI